MIANNEVTHYLDQLPDAERKALEKIRRQILQIMPQAEERLSRGVPFFYYKGKRALGFRSSKTHLSFFIMEGKVLNQYRPAFSQYKNSSTVIEFSPAKPLEEEIVDLLVRARMEEIDQKASNKKLKQPPLN